MTSIVIPADYRYVLAGVAAVPLVAFYHSITVGKARKQSKVALPALFASEAEAAADPLKKRFNCAQKSHMNFTENAPFAVIGALITGLQFPKLAASLIAAWSVFRVIYHISYSSGNPDHRIKGAASIPIQLVLCLTAFVSAVSAAISN